SSCCAASNVSSSLNARSERAVAQLDLDMCAVGGVRCREEHASVVRPDNRVSSFQCRQWRQRMQASGRGLERRPLALDRKSGNATETLMCTIEPLRVAIEQPADVPAERGVGILDSLRVSI